MSDIDERLENFIVLLQKQGYDITTEPVVNKSKVWGGRCFRTVIENDEMVDDGPHSWKFYTYAGEGWYTRSTVEALRWLQEDLLGMVGHDTYEDWIHEDAFYEHELGEEAARQYYEESKQNERELHEALGDELFYKFYYIDQPEEEDETHE